MMFCDGVLACATVFPGKKAVIALPPIGLLPLSFILTRLLESMPVAQNMHDFIFSLQIMFRNLRQSK